MGGKPRAPGADREALRAIADLQAHDTIGRAVLAPLARTNAVTLAGLIAALEEAERRAPRAVGGFEPERYRAEAALARLRQLRPERG